MLLAGWHTLVSSFADHAADRRKRARTCLPCASSLRVVCPQLIDCARALLNQTLHGLRVTSSTRVMETLIAWPISKTSQF